MLNISAISAEFIADISGHVIIAITSDGKVIYHNRKAKCVFADIWQNDILYSYLSDDDKIVIKHNIDAALYQQQNLDFYWNYKGRFYLINIYIFKQLIWLVFKDISELRQVTHRLNFNVYQNEQSEQLARLGYWQLNISQKQFYWSDGMYRLLNLQKSRSHYHSGILKQHMTSDDFSHYKHKIKEMLQNQIEAFSGQLHLMMSDKTIKNCYISARRDYFNGEDVIIGILQESNNEINNYDIHPIEIAQLAHDIKHHLQALSSLKITNEASKDMQVLKEYHINKITDLVEDMITSSKIDNQQVNLADLLSKLCSEYQLSEYNHKVKVICRLNNVYIRTDAHKLYRIVGNLLANALKFARSKIILGNDKNSIWVADDGAGISYEKQTDIFKAFYQTDNQVLRGIKGDGLGLYTVNELCRDLNIRLNLKSQPQCYSIFKLHFD